MPPKNLKKFNIKNNEGREIICSLANFSAISFLEVPLVIRIVFSCERVFGNKAYMLKTSAANIRLYKRYLSFIS